MSNHRVVRIASLLSLEVACYVLERENSRIAEVITQPQARDAFKEIVNSLKTVTQRLMNIDAIFKRTTSEEQRQNFKKDLVSRLARFLRNVRNLMENHIRYETETESLTIYQNEDFRENVQAVLTELERQWKKLTDGLPIKDDLAKLIIYKREIPVQLASSSKYKRDNHNSLTNLHIEHSRSPRQF